jgi:cyanamide hydratase
LEKYKSRKNFCLITKKRLPSTTTLLQLLFFINHSAGTTLSSSQDHFGWQAVPRSTEAFLKTANTANTKSFNVSDITVPTSEVAKKTQDYAKKHLPGPTYNHSMRVFYYGTLRLLANCADSNLAGMALLLNRSPSSIDSTPSLVETFFLSCLLHDIGTVPSSLHSTRLSFELWGAIEALKLLPDFGASQDQAELVAEVINRHQDLGDTGTAPAILGLIYFATIFGTAFFLGSFCIRFALTATDNVGLNPQYIHQSTIEHVVAAYPRHKWSGCFASTIEEEISAKPWCHSTVIENFREHVLGNKLMEPYE